MASSISVFNLLSDTIWPRRYFVLAGKRGALPLIFFSKWTSFFSFLPGPKLFDFYQAVSCA